MNNDLIHQSLVGGGVEVDLNILSDFRELTCLKLRMLCRQQGLSAFGRKIELVERLTIAKERHTKQHVNAYGTAHMADGQLMTRRRRRVGKMRGR